jgi:ribosome maturation factor RimP
LSQYSALKDIIAPIVEAEGFEFWGLEYSKQKTSALLRIYIDGEEGISVDDCAKVSRELSIVLDVEDPIATEYRLEISSPGMDRRFFQIEQFSEYVGAVVKVKLHTLYEGRRQLTGILSGVDLENSEIGVVVEEEEYLLPYELVDRAQVVPTYE